MGSNYDSISPLANPQQQQPTSTQQQPSTSANQTIGETQKLLQYYRLNRYQNKIRRTGLTIT